MDQDYKTILKRFKDEVTSENPLSKAEQELTIISALTVLQANDDLKEHFSITLNTVSVDLIREVVYQLSPAVGSSKVKNALRILNTVTKKDGQHFAIPEDTYKAGLEFQEPLYGNEIKDLMADLPANAGKLLPEWLTKNFFGDYYTRGALPVKDRERYLLAALITMNVDFQIKAHALGSLKAGNTESELIWTALTLLPYIGFPLVINSVQKIHQANE